MFDISNMTQVVAGVSSLGISNLISFIIVLFISVIGSYALLDFLHNKHMETIAKQSNEATTMAIQHIEQMVSMAITSTQAMDITDSVLKAKNSEPEKKQ